MILFWHIIVFTYHNPRTSCLQEMHRALTSCQSHGWQWRLDWFNLELLILVFLFLFVIFLVSMTWWRLDWVDWERLSQVGFLSFLTMSCTLVSTVHDSKPPYQMPLVYIAICQISFKLEHVYHWIDSPTKRKGKKENEKRKGPSLGATYMCGSDKIQ